jgi:hypothetical protein
VCVEAEAESARVAVGMGELTAVLYTQIRARRARSHVAREDKRRHPIPRERLSKTPSPRKRFTEASSGSAGIKARSTEATTSQLDRPDRGFSEIVAPTTRGSA